MLGKLRRMVHHVFTDDDGSGDEVVGSSKAHGEEVGSSKRVHTNKNGFITNDVNAKSAEKSTKGKSGAKVSKSKNAPNEQYTINTDANIEYIIREEEDGGKNSETKFLVKLSVKPVILSRTEIAERFPVILERYNAKKEREAQYEDDEGWDRDSDDEVQFVNEKENTRKSPRKRIAVKKNQPVPVRHSGRIGGKPAKGYADAEGKVEQISDEEVDEEFKVERILEMREVVGGKRQFRVKWEGFDRRYNTWEPEENLEHLDVFQKYIGKMEKEGSEGSEKVDGDNGKKTQKKEEPMETPRSTRRSETKGGSGGRSAQKETNGKAAKVEINGKAAKKESKVDEKEEEGNDDESDDDEEAEFEVEYVIARRKVTKKGGEVDWKYRVKWKGYDEISWEPSENVEHLDVVKAFIKQESAKDAASDNEDGDDEGEDDPGPSSSSAEQKEKKRGLKRSAGASGEGSGSKRGRGRPLKK